MLAFNWVATALHALLATTLKIGCTNFYDDFVVVERRRLAASADEAVEDFFQLLGWTLKDLPGFAPVFSPLGGTIVLDKAERGEIVAGNRPERVDGASAGHHRDPHG